MTTAQASIPTIPTTLELVELARRALQRCGVDPHALTAGPDCITASSPLTGETLFDVPASTPPTWRPRSGPRTAAFLTWRTRAGTRARRVVKRLGELLDRAQGRPRRPDHHRGRQDPLRGPGRGPGDDRHLRLRRRPVAPARRPHHALRAAGTPADGDLAPARRRRRHLARSTSRPPCGRGTRPSPSSAATPWCGSRRRRQPWSPSRQVRSARRAPPAMSARPTTSTCSWSPTPPARQALVDSPRVAAGQRHRVRADGRADRPARRRALRPPHARARRQQRRGRRAVRRPRPGRTRHRLRRRRHRRAALHHDAPRHRARVRSPTSCVDRLASRVRADCRSATRFDERTLVGPLIDERPSPRCSPRSTQAAADGGDRGRGR